MDKINPTQYITDTDPVLEEVLQASNWFTTEYMTLNYDTRSNVGLSSYIGWYIAQGWVVYGYTSYPHMRTDTEPRTYYGVYNLKRRKLQSERVLQSIITDFTTAYNEGRAINDQRYDELVTIYSTMLDKSEDTMIADAADDSTYEGLIEAVIGSIGTDHTAYAADVDGALDDWGDSIMTQIEARFDAQLATARQQLVDRGMYNSTVWDSVAAGIERERALAKSDFEDKRIQQQLGLKHKVHAELTNMRSKVIEARDRLHAKLHGATDQRLASRNAILQAMLSFMERRQDDYPELSGIADIAAKLGYGDNPASTVMP